MGAYLLPMLNGWGIYQFYLNKTKAIASVIKTLKVCAIKNAYNGFLLFSAKRSLKLVSKPILVKASANHKPCKFFRLSLICAPVSADTTKENSNDAPIKPNTNFGKRSQITLRVGFLSGSVPVGCLV